VTGAFLDQAELSGKWLELMREGVPGIARVTAMHDASTPADQSCALRASANVLKKSSPDDQHYSAAGLRGAFAAAARNGAQAVVLPVTLAPRGRLRDRRVSECGKVRHGVGGHPGGNRRRSVQMLPTLTLRIGECPLHTGLANPETDKADAVPPRLTGLSRFSRSRLREERHPRATSQR